MEAKLDNKVEVELKYKPKKKNNELIIHYINYFKHSVFSSYFYSFI